MKLPLTKNLNNNDTIAWNENGEVSLSHFLKDVMMLVKELPDHKYAINLCEERYSFMVAFAAVLVKNQTNLLPQSRIADNVNVVAEAYPDNYCITKSKISGIETEQVYVSYELPSEDKARHNENITPILIDSEHIAAIAFTSGSTGQPQANSKTWGELVSGAQMIAERFGFIDEPALIVATVPPQHMYGLEASILYSLQNGCPVYAGKPFYPDDIRSAIESASSPVVLVTTPVHLRACNSTKNLSWSNIKFIISATAPLRNELAKQVSKNLKTKVNEIFGSTETGAIASREPLKSDIWTLLSGLTISRHNNKTIITRLNDSSEVVLSDVTKIIDEHNFKLIGRDADMVNIAGKRGSLSDLTSRLQSIDGVNDAVVFYPESDNEINRLTAFIVTDKIDEKKISSELALQVDRVFIPRPIYKVEKLPYNATGKLPQKELQDMHQQCIKKKDKMEIINNSNFKIGSNHPCLEGHFPNNPIVPGVVIMDEVNRIILKIFNGYVVSGYSSVKFMLPLKAEQMVTVNTAEKFNVSNDYAKVKFSIDYNEKVIAQGEVKLEKLK